MIKINFKGIIVTKKKAFLKTLSNQKLHWVKTSAAFKTQTRERRKNLKTLTKNLLI